MIKERNTEKWDKMIDSICKMIRDKVLEHLGEEEEQQPITVKIDTRERYRKAMQDDIIKEIHKWFPDQHFTEKEKVVKNKDKKLLKLQMEVISLNRPPVKIKNAFDRIKI